MKQTCRLGAPSFLVIRNSFSTTSSLSQTVINISNSLKQKGVNWDVLSNNYSSTLLTNSVVQQVLLSLKQPSEAKLALGFFHWSASHNQSRHSLPNYAIAIHILVKGKLIKDAKALLHSAITKTNLDNLSFVDSLISSYEGADSVPLVFDLLVQSYAKLRMFDLGFDVCECLSEKGFTLSIITYNTLLHVVQKSEKTKLVWKIYEHMVRNRTYPNDVTVRIMIQALCKEGKLEECVDMVDRISGKRSSPSMLVNAELVFRMLEEGRINEGVALMRRMLQKGMILDSISYSFVVYSRVKSGSLELALEVYGEMLNRGFQANSFVYTLFIGAYCEKGKVEDAMRLVQEMGDIGLKPYAKTFDHLIVGCSKVGNLEESTKLCKEMMEMGFLPRCSAFNELAGKLCETKSTKEADDMLTSLIDKGFKPDEVTYAWLIDGYAKEGKIEEALKLYYEMEYKSISASTLVFESLISYFSACGKLAEAEKFLKVMKDRPMMPSPCIYKTMTDGYCALGNKTRALHLYSEISLLAGSFFILRLREMTANKVFTNKLWNAGNFVLQNRLGCSATYAWETVSAHETCSFIVCGWSFERITGLNDVPSRESVACAAFARNLGDTLKPASLLLHPEGHRVSTVQAGNLLACHTSGSNLCHLVTIGHQHY